MWRDFYKMDYAIEENTVFTRLIGRNNEIFFNLPMSDNIPKALQILVKEEKEKGHDTLRFCTIPEEYEDLISHQFENPKITEEIIFSDYLYSAEDLVRLNGRKYSPQRNLIHQFERNVDNWSFSIVDNSNIEKVITYYHEKSQSTPDMSAFAYEENRMVEEVLNNLDSYGMIGGLLEANGQTVGFSFGEIINDTLYVHIERADRHVKGAYQMVVNQFAKMFADERIRFINREEDMGDEGLREVKRSYHPILILKKYTIEGVIK